LIKSSFIIDEILILLQKLFLNISKILLVRALQESRSEITNDSIRKIKNNTGKKLDIHWMEARINAANPNFPSE
jgi:hypothetical protein